MADAVLRVRVTPRAGRTEVTRVEDGVAHVRVAAPPVEGAANEALIRYLADALGVRKSALSIRSGAGSREKSVRLEGMDADEALERLRQLAAPEKGA